MYVHIPTDQVVQPGRHFTFEGENYTPTDSNNPAKMAALGFTELTRVDVPPADPENYYRTETRTGAVATAEYTLKNEDQLKEIQVRKLDAQIENLERAKPFTHRGERDFKGGVAVGLLLICDSLELLLDSIIAPPVEGEAETDAKRIALKQAVTTIRSASNKTYALVASVETPASAIRQQRKAITG